jgi:hypothetical protein
MTLSWHRPFPSPRRRERNVLADILRVALAVVVFYAVLWRVWG